MEFSNLFTGSYAVYIFVIVAVVTLFFLRNPLKVLLSTFAGYRRLDDYSIAIHNNLEAMADNDRVRMTKGVNLQNTILLISALPVTLINPLLFALVYGKYKYGILKAKLPAIKDFSIFDNADEDPFLKFINSRIATVNLVVDEMYMTGYLFLAVGIFTKSMAVGLIGFVIITALLLATMFALYNTAMYRTNYKYVTYFRALRTIGASSLTNKTSMIILTIISLAAGQFFPELSVYLWSLVTVRIAIWFVVNGALKREAFVSSHHQAIENRDYENLHNVASYPNLISQSRGYRYTSALQMKFFELEKRKEGKRLIHLDNFSMFPQTINKTDLRKNPLLTDTLLNSIKISLEALDFTKQILVLGGMGSGKTQMINSLVAQVHESDFETFQAIAYNDVKGDFTKDFYREGVDILVNIYDRRAAVWCPFLEMNTNIEAGTTFINNLYESLAGTEKDFFSGRAKQLSAQWLQEAYYATDDNIAAWDMFFGKIKAYEDELKAQDDRTKSSILQTIQIALEILSVMHYQVTIERRETFTFYDFVRAQGVQLFFVNSKQYEAKLTPYLNGLAAAYINTVMAKEDTKDHLILNIFDEFLTMKVDVATRKTLLTATRSKGFCNVLAAQYLINDEKLIQDLDSSRYALITFAINDKFTLNNVISKMSEAEAQVASSSPQQKQEQQIQGDGSTGAGIGAAFQIFGGVLSAFGKKNNISYSLGMTKVILEQQLQSMPKYHHLTFIPSEEVKVIEDLDAQRFFKLMLYGYDKLMGEVAAGQDFLAKDSGVLYLGYTPPASIESKGQDFVVWDMKPYYLHRGAKVPNVSVQQEIFSEKTQFIHYMNVKFASTVEDAKVYMQKHNLDAVDIDKTFTAVEENPDKVMKLISKYSEQQRYDLMEQFFDIPFEDLDAKYEFCKQHDLIGAILGIFTFSDDFRERMLGEDHDA